MSRRAAALMLMALSAGLRAGDIRKAEACVGIADGRARLACFDAAYGVVPGALGVTGGADVPAARAVPAPAVRPVPEFGDRGQLHKDAAERAVQPKRVDFKVAKVENLRGGLFRLIMDNGQVWVTREADWALEFKVGDEVTIQRMIAGGFRVSHKGQSRNVTVARIS